jgi:hypothetical protein
MEKASYNAVVFSRPGEESITPIIGALWAAENDGLLSEVVAWVCPSTTSLITIMYICGYKCIEIIAILNTVPELLTSYIAFKNLTNLGIDITELKNKFTEIIRAKLITIPTLKQFYDEYGISIITVGMNLEKQMNEYINSETYPNITLVDFLCISFSTPGIYKPYRCENVNWIDGSIIEAFPIESIDLECGLILAISNSQKIVSLRSNDPLTQVKNFIRCLNEASRFSNIKEYSNVKYIIIVVEELLIPEENDTPFSKRLSLQFGNDIINKLYCGWMEFKKTHYEFIQKRELNLALQQE